MAFSPDGTTVAAGYGTSDGGVGGVVLWDTARRNRLAEGPLAVTEGFVSSVAFSPDSKIIAAAYGGHRDGGVVLWDAAASRETGGDPLAVKEGQVD